MGNVINVAKFVRENTENRASASAITQIKTWCESKMLELVKKCDEEVAKKGKKTIQEDIVEEIIKI